MNAQCSHIQCNLLNEQYTSSFMHVAIMSIQWSGTKTPWMKSHRNGWRWIFIVALSIVSMCVVSTEFRTNLCHLNTLVSSKFQSIQQLFEVVSYYSVEPCIFQFPYEINAIGTKTIVKRRRFYSYCQQCRHWCYSYLGYFACRCVLWLSLVADFAEELQKASVRTRFM